jgi:hypothetical protein
MKKFSFIGLILFLATRQLSAVVQFGKIYVREWRKLHNEKLHDLYSSPSIIRIIKSRRIRWAGHVTQMGEKRNSYRLLVGKPEGKRQLGRPRTRWMDNIRMNLGEVGWCVVDWMVWLKIGTGGGFL